MTGLPAGALNVITGLGKDAGAPLSQHPDIDKISFTGEKVCLPHSFSLSLFYLSFSLSVSICLSLSLSISLSLFLFPFPFPFLYILSHTHIRNRCLFCCLFLSFLFFSMIILFRSVKMFLILFSSSPLFPNPSLPSLILTSSLLLCPTQ